MENPKDSSQGKASPISSKIRVLIADDHRLFADALAAILATDDRFEVVGQANNGEKAVELAASENPDVVLMDISMPRLDGVEAARQITKKRKSAAVLMLTGSSSAADVARAREAGAEGYVTKDRIASELIDSIVQVAEK
jgi:DNA-binding NarL/FixJ family response regulator